MLKRRLLIQRKQKLWI